MSDLMQSWQGRVATYTHTGWFDAKILRRMLSLSCAIVAISAIYLAQLWTPLRLNGDAIVLLSIASSAADGHGYLDHGVKTHYPPGYPAMVVVLDRLELASSSSLVGLNAAFLFLGYISAYYIARQYYTLDRRWRRLSMLFGLLSFALIKHFTLPLTDIPFLGLSLLSLAMLVRAESQEKLHYALWVTACILAVATVFVRPVGIALFPALAWSLIQHAGLVRTIRSRPRLLISSCALVAIFGAIAGVILLHTKYVQEALVGIRSQGISVVLWKLVAFRIREAGELAINLPASKLGGLSLAVEIIGIVAIAWVVFTLRAARLGSVEIYFAAYAAIFVIWPYGDARFWVPVVPILSAGLIAASRPWEFAYWKKVAAAGYLCAYVLAGILALAYSTWITFSGPRFADRYGDAHLRPTYELFYAERSSAPPVLNEPALELLRRYAQ
jgi:hypothetical protein